MRPLLSKTSIQESDKDALTLLHDILLHIITLEEDLEKRSDSPVQTYLFNLFSPQTRKDQKIQLLKQLFTSLLGTADATLPVVKPVKVTNGRTNELYQRYSILIKLQSNTAPALDGLKNHLATYFKNLIDELQNITNKRDKLDKLDNLNTMITKLKTLQRELNENKPDITQIDQSLKELRDLRREENLGVYTERYQHTEITTTYPFSKQLPNLKKIYETHIKLSKMYCIICDKQTKLCAARAAEGADATNITTEAATAEAATARAEKTTKNDTNNPAHRRNTFLSISHHVHDSRGSLVEMTPSPRTITPV